MASQEIAVKSEGDYHLEGTAGDIVRFSFLQVNQSSMKAWNRFHAEQYRAGYPVFMIISVPQRELLPFAHMTKSMKAWINSGAPVTPTRHAYVTSATMPTATIQGLLKTLPPVDLKAMFFADAGEACAWLLAEQAALSPQEHTTPQRKTG